MSHAEISDSALSVPPKSGRNARKSLKLHISLVAKETTINVTQGIGIAALLTLMLRASASSRLNSWLALVSVAFLVNGCIDVGAVFSSKKNRTANEEGSASTSPINPLALQQTALENQLMIQKQAAEIRQGDKKLENDAQRNELDAKNQAADLLSEETKDKNDLEKARLQYRSQDRKTDKENSLVNKFMENGLGPAADIGTAYIESSAKEKSAEAEETEALARAAAAKSRGIADLMNAEANKQKSMNELTLGLAALPAEQQAKLVNGSLGSLYQVNTSVQRKEKEVEALRHATDRARDFAEKNGDKKLKDIPDYSATEIQQMAALGVDVRMAQKELTGIKSRLGEKSGGEASSVLTNTSASLSTLGQGFENLRTNVESSLQQAQFMNREDPTSGAPIMAAANSAASSFASLDSQLRQARAGITGSSIPPPATSAGGDAEKVWCVNDVTGAVMATSPNCNNEVYMSLLTDSSSWENYETKNANGNAMSRVFTIDDLKNKDGANVEEKDFEDLINALSARESLFTNIQNKNPELKTKHGTGFNNMTAALKAAREAIAKKKGELASAADDKAKADLLKKAAEDFETVRTQFTTNKGRRALGGQTNMSYAPVANPTMEVASIFNNAEGALTTAVRYAPASDDFGKGQQYAIELKGRGTSPAAPGSVNPLDQINNVGAPRVNL